jgi:hypothetical protein
VSTTKMAESASALTGEGSKISARRLSLDAGFGKTAPAAPDLPELMRQDNMPNHTRRGNIG